MKQINFSYNWNNKLDCKAFTTMRLYNPRKYVVGEVYEIKHKGEFICKAVLMDCRKMMKNQINEFIAHLDTGYNMRECNDILDRMYKGVDFSKQKIGLYLFVKVNVKEDAQKTN